MNDGKIFFGNVDITESCQNCRLTGCKCDSCNCPDNIAGFSAFEVYGRMCRYRDLTKVTFQSVCEK